MNCLKLILTIFFCVNLQFLFAGAPFFTDDPVPTEYKDFEFYFSTSHTLDKNTSGGNLFAFETNYGAIPNMQLHIVLPLGYLDMKPGNFHTGLSKSEFGIKYRFIQEGKEMPQVAVYPSVSVPAFVNKDVTDDKVSVYLPIWFQKSWGKLTSYAGGGYRMNIDQANTNYTFLGWQAQYDFQKKFSLGGELNYLLMDTNSSSTFVYNIGSIYNLNERYHLLASAGQNFTGNLNSINLYLGFLFTP